MSYIPFALILLAGVFISSWIKGWRKRQVRVKFALFATASFTIN